MDYRNLPLLNRESDSRLASVPRHIPVGLSAGFPDDRQFSEMLLLATGRVDFGGKETTSPRLDSFDQFYSPFCRILRSVFPQKGLVEATIDPCLASARLDPRSERTTWCGTTRQLASGDSGTSERSPPALEFVSYGSVAFLVLRSSAYVTVVLKIAGQSASPPARTTWLEAALSELQYHHGEEDHSGFLDLFSAVDMRKGFWHAVESSTMTVYTYSVLRPQRPDGGYTILQCVCGCQPYRAPAATNVLRKETHFVYAQSLSPITRASRCPPHGLITDIVAR
ncbi:hypothetical protein Bbelb_106510 [Branchiostoma belcheri]|nr:hypothetical protein Bbelb_106510 [Branchiostoma belcheri]